MPPSSFETVVCRLTMVLLFTASGMARAAEPRVQQGVMDVRHLQLSQNAIALVGQWAYFEDQLLSPEESIHAPRSYTLFPKTWNEIRGSGEGYATYAMDVLLPKDAASLAVEIPQMYSSYQLWINGESVAVNGTVGKSAGESFPQWMPQTVSFENPGDTLHVVLQVSNFHHFLGGSKDPIYLGTSEMLSQHRNLSVTGNLVESSLLALLAVGFFIIYLALSNKKKVILYFALLCLTWSVRVGFSNLYVFISFIPDFDWYTMIRIEYLTLFLTMIWAILFFSRLFPKEESKLFKYFFVGSNSLFVIYTILASPLSFTEWITVYLAFCGVLLVYGTIVVLRAWINQRTGSTFLTISILLGIVIFAYDVSAYKGLSKYDPVIFSIGYVLIFCLMGVVLLKHLNIIKSTAPSISILTYKDLYK